MTQILEGLDGHISITDDMLIHGKTQKEHDERVRAVFKKPPSYQPMHHHLALALYSYKSKTTKRTSLLPTRQDP